MSICFFTCSMARSPLKATAPGTTAGRGVGWVRVAVRERPLSILSLLGQAANRNKAGSARRNIHLLRAITIWLLRDKVICLNKSFFSNSPQSGHECRPAPSLLFMNMLFMLVSIFFRCLLHVFGCLLGIFR